MAATNVGYLPQFHKDMRSLGNNSAVGVNNVLAKIQEIKKNGTVKERLIGVADNSRDVFLIEIAAPGLDALAISDAPNSSDIVLVNLEAKGVTLNYHIKKSLIQNAAQAVGLVNSAIHVI